MRSLIIIPTYNELDNLKPLIDAIFVELSASHSGVDVLVVDDNSPDGTGHLADQIAKQNPRVHVLHREKKQGLGAAYTAGFQWGMAKGYETLVEMDADFSHNPKYLPKMLELLTQNDFVIGSRYVSGGGTVNWGLGRKIISRGGSLYARLILGVPIRDFTGGFNGWKRHVLEGIQLQNLRSDGYSFQIELKHRASLHGYKGVEFPIVFEDRKVGQSKMNKRIVFEALKRVWEFRMRANDLRSHSLAEK